VDSVWRETAICAEWSAAVSHKPAAASNKKMKHCEIPGITSRNLAELSKGWKYALELSIDTTMSADQIHSFFGTDEQERWILQATPHSTSPEDTDGPQVIRISGLGIRGQPTAPRMGRSMKPSICCSQWFGKLHWCTLLWNHVCVGWYCSLMASCTYGRRDLELASWV
jgi:hypothetical protein